MSIQGRAVDLLLEIDSGTQCCEACPFCGWHRSYRVRSSVYSGPPHKENCPLGLFLTELSAADTRSH